MNQQQVMTVREFGETINLSKPRTPLETFKIFHKDNPEQFELFNNVLVNYVPIGLREILSRGLPYVNNGNLTFIRNINGVGWKSNDGGEDFVKNYRIQQVYISDVAGGGDPDLGKHIYDIPAGDGDDINLEPVIAGRGGNKSRRNKSRRNKSRRNKSRRNKSRRNKSRRNQINIFR